MATPVLSDALLQARATSLRAILDSGHTLRLFAGGITPAPDTPYADFVEASYAGYAAYPLDAEWGSVTRPQPGLWTFQAGPYQFGPASSGSQVVYGWYVDNGVDVPLSQRFAFPITITPGTSFKLVIGPQCESLSVLVP